MARKVDVLFDPIHLIYNFISSYETFFFVFKEIKYCIYYKCVQIDEDLFKEEAEAEAEAEEGLVNPVIVGALIPVDRCLVKGDHIVE